MSKAECFALLVENLGLKTHAELHAKNPWDMVSVHLSRGVGSNNRVSFLWCPEAMGAVSSRFGGDKAVRAQVIALVRVNLLGGNAVLTDNGVIAHAVARSTYFAGLWNLIDVQIGCATRHGALGPRGPLVLPDHLPGALPTRG